MYDKFIKNKQIRYSFRFMLVLLVTFFFLGQFEANFKWGRKIFGRRGKLCANENAWSKTKHGDLAAYSVFLKKHLFVDTDPYQVLVVPDSYRKTEIPFARAFFVGIPSLYLFPAKLEVSDSYDFLITTAEMNSIKSMAIHSSSYKNRRYYLLHDLDTNDYSKWAMYIHLAGEKIDIVTLPFNYIKKNKKL